MTPIRSSLPPSVLAQRLADNETYWIRPRRLAASYHAAVLGVHAPSFRPVFDIQPDGAGGSLIYVLDEAHRQALVDRMPAEAPRLTAQQRKHVEAWLASGLTQQTYCDREGAPSVRSLGEWYARYKLEPPPG